MLIVHTHMRFYLLIHISRKPSSLRQIAFIECVCVFKLNYLISLFGTKYVLYCTPPATLKWIYSPNTKLKVIHITNKNREKFQNWQENHTFAFRHAPVVFEISLNMSYGLPRTTVSSCFLTAHSLPSLCVELILSRNVSGFVKILPIQLNYFLF